jgi:F0F1-type ATP synthase assembly protein I
MTKEEEWELLVRVDERTEALAQKVDSWIETHEKIHTEQRASVQKWLGILATFIGGIIIRLIFWK